MVEKNNWKMGQPRCCAASSGFHIPPHRTYFCVDLYFENWTVFIHSPVFCFPAKTPCNTFSYCQRCWFFMMCVSVCSVVPRLIHLRQRCPNMWHSFNFTKRQATVPHTTLCLIFYMSWWENLFQVNFELAAKRRELWFFLFFTEQSQELCRECCVWVSSCYVTPCCQSLCQLHRIVLLIQ